MRAIRVERKEMTIPLNGDQLRHLDAITNSLDAITLLMETGNDVEVQFGLVGGMLRPLRDRLAEFTDSLKQYEAKAGAV